MNMWHEHAQNACKQWTESKNPVKTKLNKMECLGIWHIFKDNKNKNRVADLIKSLNGLVYVKIKMQKDCYLNMNMFCLSLCE